MMITHRKLFVSVTFCGSAAFAAAAISYWFFNTRPVFNPEVSATDSMLLLVLAAGLVLCLLALLRTSLVLLVRWAARNHHHRLLRAAHRWAPALTQAVVGTALSTSLVLASSPAAAATPQNLQASSIDATYTVAADQSQQASSENASLLPTPRWSAEPLPIQLPRVLGAPHAQRQTPDKASREIIVKPGDTLWSIADAQLGRQATIAEISAFWPRIYEANRNVIGENPDHLEPGMVLQVPHIA